MTQSDENLINEFKSICSVISAREDVYASDVEDHYVALLDFLKKASMQRQLLGNELVSIVRSYRDVRKVGYAALSVDAIAFAMHELRWPEVLEAAIQENRDYFSVRKDSLLIRLIDAFNDDWDEAANYSRYS